MGQTRSDALDLRADQHGPNRVDSTYLACLARVAVGEELAGAMRDIFRPRFEPARLLYDAFQDEASKRKSRTVEEWISAERDRVWIAARDYA